MWRAKIELQLLTEVVNAEIPIEHKLIWCSTVHKDLLHLDSGNMRSFANTST